MSKHLACLMTVIAALSTASPAVAADSQTVALPPDPDRVLLKPGECGSAVTGKDRLRWFCAEASAMSSAQEDGTIEDAGEGASSQRRPLEQQAQMERQLNAALEQLRAAHNANEATQRESEAQLAEAQQTLAGLHHKVEAFQARAAEQDSEAVAARQTVAGLQEEIDTLKARAAEQDSEAVAARQTIAGLQEEIETLEVEQAQTKAGAAEAQQIISGLREEFDALNARLKTSEDRAESYRALLGDSDHDGVADPGDLCSGTGAGRTVDRTGCAIGEEIVLEGVAFAWNSSELTPESRRLLDGLATRLNNHPDLYFEVAGHTDSTGSAEANRMLSTRRAEAVRDYLLTKGVSADRLVAVGYGEQRPIADNNDQTGRALNRRVSLSWLE